MIYGIGTDIIEVNRIHHSLEHEPGLREKLFTTDEIVYCEGMKYKQQFYAARFTAKEAFLKALGTGWRFGISFTDIEILHDKLGNPYISLSGKAKEIAEKRGIENIHVSMSHLREMATSIVILEKAG
jgi:holo-[acyl-carrier protein] synthase